ncbi:MAG: helix-turn-helix domain-containing protein, partial [Candidatus Promineifilaceae bacterium]
MTAALSPTTLAKFTTFGDLLRFLRRRSGLTQLELALEAGYSDTQISRLEQNQRLPDLPTIEARFIPALGLGNDSQVTARLLELAALVRREDAPAPGICPYKGLNYFDEADAGLFVGREAATADLVERLLVLAAGDNVRFLAVVGASGSGKSSLVRAGLVPALRQNESSASWEIHLLTPTAHPLHSLAEAVTCGGLSLTATAALIDDMAQERRSLQLHAHRSLGAQNGGCLVLVVDQFEELFAHCRSEAERAAFVDNLLTAAGEAGGPVLVVITLRADFYAHCAAYGGLRRALATSQQYIGAMSEDELRRMIEESARRGHWEFEPGLVELLLHDAGQEPGALPLLSHALYETWQRRRGRTMTFSGYAACNGVRGAIAETAETVFNDQFTPEQQVIARRIFLRLTEMGDERSMAYTRRRATYGELILKPEEAETTFAVLRALADARLVTTGEETVEVAHEALIREWPTLRSWLEEDREELRLHRQLTEAAQEWQQAGRDPGMLYRGARLAQAREWSAAHEAEMNGLEQAFLGESIDDSEREAAEREAQRQRELDAIQRLAEAEAGRAEEQARAASQLRRRAYYLAGAFVAALLLAVWASLLWTQARQSAAVAKENEQIAFARELAAAAISRLGDDPELSILLALQAIGTTSPGGTSLNPGSQVLPEAEEALHQALLASHVRGRLSLGYGNSNGEGSSVIAYSPDGAYLARGGVDGSVSVWDTATYQELPIVSFQAADVAISLAISPDGAHLAVGGVGSIKVYELAGGKLVHSLVGHKGPVTDVVFSRDGRLLLSGSSDTTA